MPGFEAKVLPELLALRYFRRAPEAEIEETYRAYRDARAADDFQHLIDTWCERAEPTRARLGRIERAMQAFLPIFPAWLRGASFLAITRAALEAGVRFRSSLRPATRDLIEREFPWLEARHTHVPTGYAPSLEFPAAYTRFIDGGTLDDARVRWQLTVCLNEVQQYAANRLLARTFALPSLLRHAERERLLALHYFACSAPRVTLGLWAQTMYVLDGLNAVVYEAAYASRLLLFLVPRAAECRREWAAFLSALDEPQLLLNAPAQVSTSP